MHPRIASILALLAGCGGGASSGADAPIGAPGESADELAVASPGRWIVHPGQPPTPTAALALGDGRCVVATEEGERWLVPAAGERCGGASLGSTAAAPEPLRRVVRDGVTLRFVGESGTLYEAREPLGAFTRIIVPPAPLGRVATRADVTVGLSSAGAPYVLDGEGWVRADAGGARLFDLDVDSSGRVLAIAWPERVLASTDRGHTFRPITPAPGAIGALAIRAQRDGSLGVAGVRGHLAWGATGTLSPSPPPAEKRNDAAPAEVRPVRLSPSAAAVAEGRAALAGRRWYELRQAADLPEDEDADEDGKRPGPSGWALVRGRLGDPSSFGAIAVPRLIDEREVRLAAHGRHVAIASIVDGEDDGGGDDDDGGAHLALMRSADEGATLLEIARLRAPDVRQVRLAIGPTGDVLVTGACAMPSASPPQTSSGPAAGGPAARRATSARAKTAPCRPRAPLLVRPGPAPPRTTTTVAGVASDQHGAPLSPAFSADGALLYFLGRRAKGREPSIFVSSDGARSWSARPMRRRGGGAEDEASPSGREHWDEDSSDRDGESAIELLAGTPLTVDAEGTLGFAVQASGSLAWVVADADGEVRGITELPGSSGVVAGSGRRALAADGRDQELATWETSDGGATWSPAGTHRVRLEGELALACSAAGCAVGQGATRIGWGAAGNVDPPAAAPAPAGSPALRTPLSCELDPKGWSALPAVELTSPFPGTDEVARGRAAWSVLAVDRVRSVVTVHHVPLEGEGAGRIVARPLLEPLAPGKGAALRLAHQGEGYAATRLVDGARELEVGWANFFEGVFGRRVTPLPAGATLRTPTEGGVRNLETGLVSVASGGVFVQPVPGAREASFLDLRGGSIRADLPDWGGAGVVGGVRDDAARVGGRNLFVGVVDAGPMVGLLGVRSELLGALSVAAATLAPPAAIGATSVTSWTYAGSTPGFLVVAADTSGDGWSSAVWRAFGEDGQLGPPVGAPTLTDLGERPRACRPEEVKGSPRIESHLVAPGRGQVMARGQRHPVVIPGAGEGTTPDGALHLLTAGAVLHGTPSSPCVAGWEATGIDGRRAAAVILGDLTRAWVFRLATPPAAGGAPPGAPSTRAASARPPGTVDVEVRAMTCRWDPAAAVAEGVWDEIGVR